MIKISEKVDKTTLTTDSAMIFRSLLNKELLQTENGFFQSSAMEEIDKIKKRI